MQARSIKTGEPSSTVMLTAPAEQNTINRNRHAPACMFCNHVQLMDIELDYIHWLSYREIMARYFQERPVTEDSITAFRQSLARHSAIFGLDKRRNSNVLAALGRIAERGLDSLNGQKIAPHTTIEALKEISKLKDEAPLPVSNEVDIPGSREALLSELEELVGVPFKAKE